MDALHRKKQFDIKRNLETESIDKKIKQTNKQRTEKLLRALEIFYSRCYDQAQNSNTEPLEIKDGKVVIPEGTIYHRLSNNISTESLESISSCGILATEWFGALESEIEGRFCAFASRTLDEDSIDYSNYSYKGKQKCLSRIRSSIHNTDNCVLFFDTNNEIMQELSRLDYFEYEHIKAQNPEKLSEIYSKEEIELFEFLIEPLSGGGKNFHNNETMNTYDWLAIPAGIPPQLVNGIMLNNNCPDLQSKIETIKTLFPNATIFDQSKSVISMPLKSNNQESI